MKRNIDLNMKLFLNYILVANIKQQLTWRLNS